MVVDRGELRYKIQVDDAFTNPIRKFREELLLAKGTIESVKNSTLGFKNLKVGIDGAARATKSFREERTRGNSAEREEQARQLKNLRELAARQKVIGQNEKIRASLAKEIAQRNKQAEQAAIRSSKAQEVAAKKALDAQKRARAEAKKFRDSLLQSGDAANRVGFTFRRLIGILAAFTVARQGVQAFTGLVAEAVSFNRVVEDSRIGLASLFSALGDVRNANGDLVTGQEAFAEATKIASSQMEQLRVDSLRTAATFSDLVETFQTAIGPGLTAGLQVDEIRQLAVKVSQAAAAIGVPQNQLAEEIRALLIPGAATSRTSRIFTVLQISPEELKRAKEGGQLFEFLNKRLKAFDFAAEATQKTFTGLLARLRDAVGIGAGAASIEFFDSLKVLLSDLGDLFVTIERDANGAIKAISPNPAAVAVLQELFAGLRDAVGIIREGLGAFDLSRVLGFVKLVSGLFRGLAFFATGVIQGLVAGFGDMSKFVRSIFGAVDPKGFQEIVKLVTRIVAVFGSFSLLILGAVGGLKLLAAPLFLAVSLVSKLTAIARTAFGILQLLPGKFLASIGAVAAVIGLISFGLKEGLSSLLDFEVGFRDLPAVLGTIIEQIGSKIVGLGRLIFTTISVRARQAFRSFVNEAGAAFATLANLLDSGLAAGGSSDAAVRLANREAAIVLERNKVAQSIRDLELEIKEVKLENAQIDADANRLAGEKIDKLRTAVEKAKELKDPIAVDIDTTGVESKVLSVVDSLNASINGLFGAGIVDEPGLKEALEKAQALIQKSIDDASKVTPKIAEGAASEFEKAFQKIIENADSFLDIMVRAVDRFSQFAGDAIVDAFDPTTDVDIGERFARLLQDIAKQIIATLVKVAVAKAALGVSGLFGGGEVADTAPGFAEGGEIPVGKAKPHARPAHVDPRDTTPIWAQPGEFMQRLSAVQKYGTDVMEAINNGLIDPTALKALAGIGSHRKMRVAGKHGPGYVSGGTIQTQAQAIAATPAVAAVRDQGPTIALVAGNEQSMDKLLAGGKRAMLDFIKANGPAIDGLLSRNRQK